MAGTPKEFRGGWQAMMKPVSHHKPVVVENPILAFAQTPKTYAAWTPGGDDTPTPASNALLDAKKHFFDDDSFLQLGHHLRRVHANSLHRVREEPDPIGVLVDAAIHSSQESEDEEAPALLERSSVSVDSVSVSAAAVVLAEYARNLKSPSLAQLSRAKLSLPRMQRLWQAVSAAAAAPGSGHEAQAAKWCQDFQRDAKRKAVQREAQRQAAENLAEAGGKVSVLQQEITAQDQMLGVFKRDATSLQSLQSQVEHQFDSTDSLIQAFREEVSSVATKISGALGTDAVVEITDLSETLGKAEGLVNAGGKEVVDIVKSMIGKRSSKQAAMQEKANQVKEQLSSAKQEHESLLQRTAITSETTADDEQVQSRYEQMCKWTLEEMNQKQHKEQREKDAIHAALIILQGGRST